VRAFSCQVCGQLVFFENSACLRCGASLGFVAADGELHTLALTDDGAAYTILGPAPDDTAERRDANASVASERWVRCANAMVASCNWLVREPTIALVDDPAGDDETVDPEHEPDADLCLCCQLTRTRPNDDDVDALAAFADTEAAKRRLVFQLLELGLPVITEDEDPDRGLAFDLLSSRYHPVTIGHADGLITLDLSESDDAHREQVRQDLGEPYRTMLGHLRHEVGHYYWQLLVEPDPTWLARFRTLFGDETQDYGDAIDHHYGTGDTPGAVEDWQDEHVSSYATMHPWEDWAETFAHELHILDTLQTAAAYGMKVTGPDVFGHEPTGDLTADPDPDPDAAPFDAVLDDWLPLTYALNGLNRSMGKADLYPFVLAPAVVDKLAFVHELVQATADAWGAPPLPARPTASPTAASPSGASPTAGAGVGPAEPDGQPTAAASAPS
jgi:hypothetical protein